MITTKNLNEKLRELKKQIKAEIESEFPKEIKAEIRAEYKFYISDNETENKKERQNLIKRGFKFKERIKPKDLMWHYGFTEYETWEKYIGEMKI